MKEMEIILTAAENIPKDIGINIEWEKNPVNEIDGQILFTFKNQEIRFNTEIKKELREHQLPNLEIVAKNNPPFILAVHYLRPKIKTELRKRKIAYLEKNGNLFINYKEILILIDANKPIDLAKETGNRAFTKTGLRIVYLYLTDENWINQTQRKIAELTKTGLGNINNVNHGLEKEGFLLKINREEKRLQNKKTLLEKWMKAFDINLQPALKIGRFRFMNENNFTNWRNIPIDTKTTWWGGEPAGNILTNYLRPGELTLYTTKNRNELIKEYKLIPDPNGNIKVFNTFWDTGETLEKNTVHPLLIYVDLMNTGDNRCQETAQIIWDKYLTNEF